ncbi:MAG: hypothetical protein QXR02_01525 [Acidilobaceae archaeon]
MGRDRIKEIIRKHAWRSYPGLYEVLELACYKEAGVSCIDLLIDNSEALLAVLNKVYGGRKGLMVRYILKNIFIKPIVSQVLAGELEDALTTLLLNSPREFNDKVKIILKELGRVRNSYS